MWIWRPRWPGCAAERGEDHTHADIHEKDLDYLRRCLHTADRAADYYGWTRIPFQRDGVEREVDEKNQELYRILLETI